MLHETTTATSQIRSYALLKLYFGQFAQPDDISAPATAQLAALQTRIEAVEAMLARLKARPDREWQLAVAGLFFQISNTLLHQWTRVGARAARASRVRTRPKR